MSTACSYFQHIKDLLDGGSDLKKKNVRFIQRFSFSVEVWVNTASYDADDKKKWVFDGAFVFCNCHPRKQ